MENNNVISALEELFLYRKAALDKKTVVINDFHFQAPSGYAKQRTFIMSDNEIIIQLEKKISDLWIDNSNLQGDVWTYEREIKELKKQLNKQTSFFSKLFN